ncbi:UspA domain protein [Salinarchaeum sp. Harcht-Bsk1]|uniref:universal stress protein n=1 Tax=Salinarchaeum sp. Harcht-Bsk1 TaxID=1333523 RepID=UPI0003423C8A|nr:universal stress protein [Salinarchaeum sp. Harcht-Bsk1]AGN00916.1 UspA domain protein [Salinarchaeum sp. Harcht-Bsk1]
MYDRILVPVDGSPVGETAAATAIALARRFDAQVHALHVLEVGELPPGVEDDEAGPFETQGQQALDEVSEQAVEAGVEVTTSMITGDADVHRAILGYVDEHDVDCIVMGTHGRQGLGRLILGSVAEQTIRESPVPVMTVHEDTGVPTEFASILVPTDGSDSSNRALEQAVGFAAATGASITGAYVVDDTVVRNGAGMQVAMDALEDAGEETLASLAERAADAGAESIDTTILHGVPYRAIVNYADEEDVDCIVLGTHGRTGVDRYLLGSVTERVIRLSDVPVLTVGGPEPEE